MPLVMPFFKDKINPNPKNNFERLNNSFLRMLQALDSSDGIFRRMWTNNLTQEKLSQILAIIDLAIQMRQAIHNIHLRAEGITVGNIDDISVGGDSCLSNISSRLNSESVAMRGILPIITVDSRSSISEFIRAADTSTDLEEIGDNLKEAHNFLCIAIRIFAENARNDQINEKQESRNYVLTLMNIIIELENKVLTNAKLFDQHAAASRSTIEVRSRLGRGDIEEHERQIIEQQRQRFADEALRRQREAAAEQQRLANEASHAPSLTFRSQAVQGIQLGSSIAVNNASLEQQYENAMRRYNERVETIRNDPTQMRANLRQARINAIPVPQPPAGMSSNTRMSRPS